MAPFIVFEGGEGSGKSTQALALARRLTRASHPVLLLHEPGGTPLGRKLRLVLKGRDDILPLAELLLFAAARAELVGRVLRPALEEGSTVVLDRYTPSTVAYQGYGRGLELRLLENINHIATGSLEPDLIVLLDLPGEVGLARKRLQDRFEGEGIAFHQRVREGYLRQAAASPERWLLVDASLPRRVVAQKVWERVKNLFPQAKFPPT